MTNVVTFEKDFFMIHKGLFQIDGLKKTDKMAYIYLCSICVRYLNHSYPNLKELNNLFGITRPTFKNIAIRLENAGLIEKVGEVNDFFICNREDLNKQGNFFLMHYAVLHSKRITPRQKLIYSFIMSRANSKDMKVEISMKTIAEKCAIRDDANLRKDIQGLVSIGLVSQILQRRNYKGKLQYDKYEYQVMAIPPDIDKEDNKTDELDNEEIEINYKEENRILDEFFDSLE